MRSRWLMRRTKSSCTIVAEWQNNPYKVCLEVDTEEIVFVTIHFHRETTEREKNDVGRTGQEIQGMVPICLPIGIMPPSQREIFQVSKFGFYFHNKKIIKTMCWEQNFQDWFIRVYLHCWTKRMCPCFCPTHCVHDVWASFESLCHQYTQFFK